MKVQIFYFFVGFTLYSKNLWNKPNKTLTTVLFPKSTIGSASVHLSAVKEEFMKQLLLLTTTSLKTWNRNLKKTRKNNFPSTNLRGPLEKRKKIKWSPSTMWTIITWFSEIVDVHAHPTPDIFPFSSCSILMRKSPKILVSHIVDHITAKNSPSRRTPVINEWKRNEK